MTDVPRETPSPKASDTPPAPAAARGVFPSGRVLLAERYAALLATAGVERGLIGPREAPRLWDRHLLNCAVLGEALPHGSTVCDVGSGAGLPGLVVAIARPDLTVTLVEPLLRRTTFLEQVVDDLGLSNVEVVRGRADSLHGKRSFDVVTSRAVAPLARLLEWSMPLVAARGRLVAMKGESVADEVTAAGPVLAALGCASPSVRTVGGELLGEAEAVTVVEVVWSDPAAVSWPIVSRGSRSREARRRQKPRSNRRNGA